MPYSGSVVFLMTMLVTLRASWKNLPAADRDGFCKLDEALAKAGRRVVSVATSRGVLPIHPDPWRTTLAFSPYEHTPTVRFGDQLQSDPRQ